MVFTAVGTLLAALVDSEQQLETGSKKDSKEFENNFKTYCFPECKLTGAPPRPVGDAGGSGLRFLVVYCYFWELSGIFKIVRKSGSISGILEFPRRQILLAAEFGRHK